MELLRLKEALSNAPHAQQLAAQFATDAGEVSVLLRKFNAACSRVYTAQESLAQAYLQLSEIARVIGGKALAVQPKNINFENTSLQFSSLLEELSGLHQSHAEDIRTSLFMPPHKLPSQPGLQFVDGASGQVISFADLPACRHNMESCEAEVHASLVRYMKLPRRCAPRDHDEAVMELSQDYVLQHPSTHQFQRLNRVVSDFFVCLIERRRLFQKAAVVYHARLNASHFEREMVPLNAFCGFLNTTKKHAKRMSEMTEQPSLAEFTEAIKVQLDCRQVESVQSNEEFLNFLTALESQPLAIFAPEPLFAKSDKSYLRSPDTKLLSKAGYLHMRIKKTFGFDWTEVYCYTQSGNLLCQAKADVGASVLVNLNGKGVFAEPVDIDDRRYTFQVVCAADKSSEENQQQSLLGLFAAKRSQNVVLQAENSTDRDEWISTITNVIANTNSWTGKGESPPDLQQKEQLPFVLVPKMQFNCSETIQPATTTTNLEFQENEDLQKALRASLSCAEWITQAPPLHHELIPTGDTASITPSDPHHSDLETPLYFIGCLPLPDFMCNRASVEELADYVLAKRQPEAPPAHAAASSAALHSMMGQPCVARLTSGSLFILDSASTTPSATPAVLSHFTPSQIVHCADMTSKKPGLFLLMTSAPHSSQWCDLPSRDLHLCHFFETTKTSELAERVLNLLLMRLGSLNEEGDSAEKTSLLANIMRSSEWNSSAPTMPPVAVPFAGMAAKTATQQTPPSAVSEVPPVQAEALPPQPAKPGSDAPLINIAQAHEHSTCVGGSASTAKEDEKTPANAQSPAPSKPETTTSLSNIVQDDEPVVVSESAAESIKDSMTEEAKEEEDNKPQRH